MHRGCLAYRQAVGLAPSDQAIVPNQLDKERFATMVHRPGRPGGPFHFVAHVQNFGGTNKHAFASLAPNR